MFIKRSRIQAIHLWIGRCGGTYVPKRCLWKGSSKYNELKFRVHLGSAFQESKFPSGFEIRLWRTASKLLSQYQFYRTGRKPPKADNRRNRRRFQDWLWRHSKASGRVQIWCFHGLSLLQTLIEKIGENSGTLEIKNTRIQGSQLRKVCLLTPQLCKISFKFGEVIMDAFLWTLIFWYLLRWWNSWHGLPTNMWMHGVFFLWRLHKDHHKKIMEVGGERNDFSSLFYAFVVFFCFIRWKYFGFGAGPLPLGLSIFVYGITYFLVHDIFIHQNSRYSGRQTIVWGMPGHLVPKIHHTSI